MLCELKVENLALIESLHLCFERGTEGALVVMTGETGAGKSIMMRAIGLLTGVRASADWIRSGAESCSVEALFEISERHEHIHQLLDSGGFGDESQIVIKRVISRKGRSQIYVNGSMATARTVSEICFHLLSIASQHDHQQLLQPALHLDFLDTLGDHWPGRSDYRHKYDEWCASCAKLEDLLGQEREREQRLDFLAFQIKEIKKIAPVPGEDEQLSGARKRLKNSEALIRLSRESYDILAFTVIEKLALVRKNSEQLRALDPGIEKLAEELSSYSFLAEDFSSRIREYFEQVQTDPSKLESVNERLDQLQSLKRKYGETLDDVLIFLQQSENELAVIENLDREIEVERMRSEKLGKEALAAALKLSKSRLSTARKMEKAMETELSTLAFDRSGIEVRFFEGGHGAGDLNPTGLDRVEFFFAPNPGEPSRPLVKVASGGELSRLMLAMKCLLARKDMVETVIFDEVDAGVGGEAAEAVARKIRELADHHQVFCITHLPQIAARGTEHFSVVKEVAQDRTLTSVVALTEDDRVEELTRMLAGDSATEQTQVWAEALLAKGIKAA
jgi:DNA repair protein RecN (Recombination protein N)